MARVNIVFLDPLGKPTTDHIAGFPCIKVHVGYYGGGNGGISEWVWGLLDTGVARIRMDPSLCERFGEKLEGTFSGVLIRDASRYLARVCVDVGRNRALNVDAEVLSLARDYERVPTRVILGRAFLSRAQFVWDGVAQRYHLTFPEVDVAGAG
ncbi:hypothetical protein [Phreatobacter cathodiphilus]|uniref:Uncharacterized protein n=1 Tax=Phreatobacter cathodiphilus TaxID=1868589 RepID=A0A2S0NET1_9HYPH|nr:hypothetical protein [Phreatobacter cathodiphilus]AVO46423.1 hypothetical protein C6569_15935 [Phreatobacter cathodiphilus]